MQLINSNEERNTMKITLNKKIWVIIVVAVMIVIIIFLLGMQAINRKNDNKVPVPSSSQKADSILITSSENVTVSEISNSQSSSNLSSTSVAVDVTQSSASNSSSKATVSKIIPVSSKVSNSSSSASSKSSSVATSSAPYFPPVPTSQEIVTKKVGNNNIRLNVNAFTFEAFVDWSSVQKYMLDDFYVKIYKNGVLKKGPTLCGCVTKESTNTVAVEIDTYQSNSHWYIEPATYTIECYSQLGEHSLTTENRQNIIPCPSASFIVAIYERGFK
jgi:hypothetical protein